VAWAAVTRLASSQRNAERFDQPDDAEIERTFHVPFCLIFFYLYVMCNLVNFVVLSPIFFY
jgi:hypothetical protein